MTFDPSLDQPSSPRGHRCRTIAFTSGKGGVGKSNLVLNTGLLLARHGRRVALLDGDLGLANLSEEERQELFEQLHDIEASVDFLLIDTGAGISDTVLSLILASDESVVVTQPEPTALAAAYALMKLVIQQFPAYPFHVLINMVRDAKQARQVQRSLAEILMRFLGYTPGDAGFVVMDSWVAQAVVQQVPFTTLAPRAPASRCVEDLVDRLVGPGRTDAAIPGKTFWERVSEGPWRLT